MGPLLFHGTEIFAFFGGTFVGCGVFIAMIVWALRGPTTTWGVPLAYVLIALSFSIPVVLTDSLLVVPVIFAFPWSFLIVLLSTFVFEADLGLVWTIPSIIVNGILFWIIARYQNSEISRVDYSTSASIND